MYRVQPTCPVYPAQSRRPVTPRQGRDHSIQGCQPGERLSDVQDQHLHSPRPSRSIIYTILPYQHTQHQVNLADEIQNLEPQRQSRIRKRIYRTRTNGPTLRADPRRDRPLGCSRTWLYHWDRPRLDLPGETLAMGRRPTRTRCRLGQHRRPCQAMVRVWVRDPTFIDSLHH